MSDVRLHIQFAGQACTDGGVAERGTRGRALQRDTGLSGGRWQQEGEKGEGEGALRNSLVLSATSGQVVHGGQVAAQRDDAKGGARSGSGARLTAERSASNRRAASQVHAWQRRVV
jgi:hypothetical protein